jgi:hypothetical protein
MPIEVETLSIDQLDNLIENHRRQRVTHSKLYRDALNELQGAKARGSISTNRYRSSGEQPRKEDF